MLYFSFRESSRHKHKCPSQNCSMFPLAFVAGSLQGHWWGFISRNYVVWPIFSLMNVFIALKGTQFLNFISIFVSVPDHCLSFYFSYGLVIFITSYRWFRVLEISRYRRSNGSILKDTRKVNKFNSFIYERNFYEMPFVICFRIDKWTESMLSITSSQECSIVQLVIPILDFLLASVSKICDAEIGRELKKENIECRPWSSNTLDKSLSEVFDLFTARVFRLPFPFFLIPCDIDLRFRISKRENVSKSGILEMLPSW